MAKEIKLPKLSEDADEGTVAEIMIQKGDTIEKDDSVIAVESDKATVEVPAEEAGTVKEVKVSEGDAIKTGDVIAVLEEEDESGNGEDNGEKEETAEQDEESEDEQDEDKEEDREDEQETKKEEEDNEQKSEKEKGSEKQSEEDEQKEDKADEDGEKKAEETGEDEDKKKEPGEDEDEKSKESEEEAEQTDEEKESSGSEEINAAPAAKRLAREHDINIEDIEGSGPDELITGDDVKKAAGISIEEKSVSAKLPDFSKWGTVERQSLSEIRKATARQTQSSWQAVPHVTQFDEANVFRIKEYIDQHQNDVEEQGGKLTITAVLTKVIASALHQFPKFNASIDMDAGEVILKKYIHIGIAVNTDEGLLVPVVRDVDQKSIIELAAEITGLAEKARDNKLSSEDMKGGNFIISNLGGIGGTQFTPIIFHPQVAILGVSEMRTKPVYDKETESFRPVLTLPLSLSYDHRLIDGAEGARFLRHVCNALEDPYKALLGE